MFILAFGQAEVDGQYHWVEMAAEWFNVTIKQLKISKEMYHGEKRCMFISNHSSLADLCLSDAFLASRCSNLARHMVVLFVPIPSLVVLFLNSIFFFRRGGRGDNLDGFFKWVDSQMNWFNTQRYHLNVFPEGHRNRKPYVIPLKTGMLKYAYTRKLVVQSLITFGVELVIDEYRFAKHWKESTTIEYAWGELIDPTNFKTVEEFISECEKQFCTLFDQVHAIASKENQRYHQLKDEEEKKLFYSLDVSNRSLGMKEYYNSKKKKS